MPMELCLSITTGMSITIIVYTIYTTYAESLYKLINYPYTWNLLYVSATNRHPQGDQIQRLIKPRF